MKLAGNFENFDLKKNPGVLRFILPGKWKITLFSKDDSVLGTSEMYLNYERGTFRINGKIPIQITKGGLLDHFILEQDGFQITGSIGFSNCDLVTPNCNLVKGITFTINTFNIDI